MGFHLGKPILVMLAVATAGSVGLLLRPARPRRADLLLWVFAESHAEAYGGRLGVAADGPSLLGTFRGLTGRSVDMQLIFDRAENVRLVSMFMSDMRGPTVPDVAEVEINSVGKFFRPPVRDVGFLPLNGYLDRPCEIGSTDDAGREGQRARLAGDGRTYRRAGGRWVLDAGAPADTWHGRIIGSRLAPYTKGGVIFGLPHDVHPVALAYRHDLFTEAGIDLLAESADRARPLTWPRFHELCLAFKAYWAAHGQPGRHPIELRTMGTDNLVIMLLQRHLNLIAADGRIRFGDPGFAETVAFYARMVAGDRRVGAQPGAGESGIAQDLNDGTICALMTPDWKVGNLKAYAYTDPATGAKPLAGRMRLIPLPVFEPGKDARTGTWGGTMIGILRNTPRPDDAWRLVEHLYLSDASFETRIRETNILPPVIAQWDDARYDRADPFFGGQRVDRLYVELARELPDRYVLPASKTALAALNGVLYKAVAHARDRNGEGLEEACREWLREAAADLEARVRWGTFE